ESYNLFLELIENIKLEAIKALQSVQLRKREEIDEELQKSTQELKDSVGETQLSTDESPALSTKKPARNDPCPCGSGKKYKNCHGASGPKKGIAARNEG
ncbi:SEC-C metal-binding domain-containing protein, partial [uncultured Helicobacter sp.]|uniref:SEC-C metal-binding domain-containing protein n=1 Tax=uncultured Helicobacter sp. TaxID=175537 RepID=UPI00260A80B0